MGREEQIVNERFKKIEELKKHNINPYPTRYDKKQSCLECSKAKTGAKISTAGRLMTKRDLGKIIFSNLRDYEGEIQLVLQEPKTPKNTIDFLKKYLDLGDFIGVEGEIFKTKTGQKSILVQKIEILSKSTSPLPEKWHGLQDKEERYRKRYLDLVMNPEVKDVFEKRSKIISAIREFLTKKGYIEVETPILQPIYGGTSAKPFESQLNALKMKVYMRISNELFFSCAIAC